MTWLALLYWEHKGISLNVKQSKNWCNLQWLDLRKDSPLYWGYASHLHLLKWDKNTKCKEVFSAGVAAANT